MTHDRAAPSPGATDPAPLPVGSLWSFVRLFLGTTGWGAAPVLGLMVLSSLTDGVGLLLLVPLLGAAGVRTDAGSVARLESLATRAFAAAHIPVGVIPVLAVFLAVTGLRALLAWHQSTLGLGLMVRFTLSLRRRLFRALSGARWQYIVATQWPDLVHALTAELDRVSMVAGQAVLLAVHVLLGMTYLALALQLSAVMTAVACLCGLALMIVLRFRARHTGDVGREMSAASVTMFRAASEHVFGMKTVKSFGAEERNAAAFDRFTDRAAAAHVAAIRSNAGRKALFDIGAALLVCTAVFVAIRVLRLAAAEVFLLLLLFARLVPRFSAVQTAYHQLRNELPAFDNVMRLILEAEGEAEAGGESPGGRAREAGGAPGVDAASGWALREGIRLSGVTVLYRGASTPALVDVDLDIPEGRTTAIVGPSGAGKSTIADVVMGLVEPQQGRILIDGRPLDPGAIHGWRERIGYVPQDTFLLHDTIRANLLWAHPGATGPELAAALRNGAADGFVARLPLGLDTVIGDRGVLLSGGERQRLALARALLRQPAILVLDEATSALDSVNERRIQASIDALHRTVTILVITHRLSAVRGADVIHVVDEGRVVESGSWDDLVMRGGRFAELAAAQGLSSSSVALPDGPDGAVAPLGSVGSTPMRVAV